MASLSLAQSNQNAQMSDEYFAEIDATYSLRLWQFLIEELDPNINTDTNTVVSVLDHQYYAFIFYSYTGIKNKT